MADDFDLLVDLLTAMVTKASENRARNKAAFDEHMAASREGREPDYEGAKKKALSKPRKVPEYSKKYGKNFKKVASKYKKKSGGWKKNGFKNAQKEAHRLTKKEMKKK